ncbi:MAG: SAP domain-containing protein [Planctomycetota bacterium]|nr:SAP domain-containing protein [Planctomycetota bacterium]
MKMQEIRARAETLGINSLRKGKESLVREIQQAEGNRDCFNRGESQTCGQLACAWRSDCR